MAKKVRAIIKLQLEAGKATPAPPVGPALGQHGVNIMTFVKEYNERTGTMVPDWVPVRSLYSFTNVMILTPCCPNAGPTGGAGVALPASSCSLIIALTFLANFYSRNVKNP